MPSCLCSSPSLLFQCNYTHQSGRCDWTEIVCSSVVTLTWLKHGPGYFCRSPSDIIVVIIYLHDCHVTLHCAWYQSRTALFYKDIFHLSFCISVNAAQIFYSYISLSVCEWYHIKLRLKIPCRLCFLMFEKCWVKLCSANLLLMNWYFCPETTYEPNTHHRPKSNIYSMFV